MTTMTRTLPVPGGRIHYEVRGSGPLLLLAAAPMGADVFAPMADALSDRYTVVTHDPRGVGRSPLDDPAQDSTPELRSDDVIALLDALGADSADMFGTSGGALTGLALAVRQPGRLRTLVAHEPPVLRLLPDAAAQLAAVEDTVAAFHRDGLGAAWQRFMEQAGYDGEHPDEDPGEHEPSEQDLADGARFFAHELWHTTSYLPDVAALAAGPVRVVVGLGVESHKLLTCRTSVALAEGLGTAPADFPGEHTGFADHPAAFAEALHATLR
ncbi:alpha/beta fold hydrolase [Actinoplanes sp. NPDC049668]|uniref:alpha/beta fold hydrolase n=1 Tax=unclassified Actinoplanes TaxID=2626549 RepID=UPI0033B37ACD